MDKLDIRFKSEDEQTIECLAIALRYPTVGEIYHIHETFKIIEIYIGIPFRSMD